jgi:hypothetical protein
MRLTPKPDVPIKPKPGDALLLWDTGKYVTVVSVSRKTFSISPLIARIRFRDVEAVPGYPGVWIMR